MKKTYAILVAIFLLGYILRVAYLPQNALTFTYDQARDAYQISQIIAGDLKILGPPTSDGNFNHGVFYYYFLSPGYLLGKGNPLAAAYWQALILSASIFIIYLLTKYLTKDTKSAIIASLLYAVSFEATQYATWLSNPSLATLTVPTIYLGLWAWLKKQRKWGSILTAIALGLSIQSNILLVYHIPPVLLWIFFSRKKIKRLQINKFMISFLIAISTMAISEIKFGFRSTRNLAEFISGNSVIHQDSLGDITTLFLNQIGRAFAYNTYPGNIGYGAVLVFGLLVYSLYKWDKKSPSWQPFLASWLLSHITIVSLGGNSTPHVLAGAGAAVCILVAMHLVKLFSTHSKSLAIILLAIVVYANFSAISKENPRGQTLFAIQKDMTLRNELQAIDYTYVQSSLQPFSLSSITVPLHINIVWTHLYNWYGKSTYGYTPSYYGQDQVGQLDSLKLANNPQSSHYLIIEPLADIPRTYVSQAISEQDSLTLQIDSKRFGDIEVQKRTSEILAHQ